MYNHVDPEQQATDERLRRRTRAFLDSARVQEPATLKKFRKQWEDGEEVKLLTGLPSCPFLGFVDADEPGEVNEAAVVGCMVHPLQNDGVDGRDCGVYDRFICEDYLCAAHDILRTEEKRLVIDAIDDSYLYGLVVTNPKFVRHLLELVARRTGAMPTAKILRRPAVLEAARRCFEQLRQWPFRSNDGIFGQVQVSGALETRRRRMPADDLELDEDPLDMLLVCMGTECESADELREARRRLEVPVEKLAQAVAREQP